MWSSIIKFPCILPWIFKAHWDWDGKGDGFLMVHCQASALLEELLARHSRQLPPFSASFGRGKGVGHEVVKKKRVIACYIANCHLLVNVVHLFSYCSLIVLLLFSYCSLIVLLLFSYCSALIVLFNFLRKSVIQMHQDVGVRKFPRVNCIFFGERVVSMHGTSKSSYRSPVGSGCPISDGSFWTRNHTCHFLTRSDVARSLLVASFRTLTY